MNVSPLKTANSLASKGFNRVPSCIPYVFYFNTFSLYLLKSNFLLKLTTISTFLNLRSVQTNSRWYPFWSRQKTKLHVFIVSISLNRIWKNRLTDTMQKVTSLSLMSQWMKSQSDETLKTYRLHIPNFSRSTQSGNLICDNVQHLRHSQSLSNCNVVSLNRYSVRFYIFPQNQSDRVTSPIVKLSYLLRYVTYTDVPTGHLWRNDTSKRSGRKGRYRRNRVNC